jgi:signal transduction histidine kinase
MDDDCKTKTQLMDDLALLRQQLTTKSEFLAIMSHELRTPLTVILGYIDMMRQGTFGTVTAEGYDILGRVHKNADVLCELVTAMLDLSRLEAGRFPVDLLDIPIPALLKELEEETQDLGKKPALEVVWRIKGTLPTLYTDRGKLKIIVKNLLSNAVKFTPQGRIMVQAQRSDGGVEFSVTDSGVGIPQNELAMIFEPFQQGVRKSLSSQHGTGLGLHIVKRLVELLGGTVAVESEVGTGSRFRLWMPRETTPSSRGTTQ